MPALQVRDLPQDTYERLVRCAADEHRSLTQQTVAILESYLMQRDKGFRTEANEPVDTELASDPRDSDRSTKAVQADGALPFTSFSSHGITYLANPEETKEQRALRKQRILDNIAQSARADVYRNLPLASDVIKEMRADRLTQLAPDMEVGEW